MNAVRFEGSYVIFTCEAPGCGAVLTALRAPAAEERFCPSCRVEVQRAADVLKNEQKGT